jgi:1,4-alpha-glucan branching enzyme
LSSRDRGELAIVLHTHMPYVEGFGTWPFGEEWLFEAMATSYLPLLELCERWADAGERSVVTFGITPVLADQLVLPAVGERFLRFMRETRATTHALDIEGYERSGQKEAADAIRHSALDYERAGDCFERLGRDLVGALRRLREEGAIELWASAATHALLPLLATPGGIRLQLEVGTDAHRARFGAWSGGFWLPECAYREGLDRELGSAGVRVFCTDQTTGGDDLDQLEPVATRGGPVALPIDWRTISLVWDERGYPADPLYRDYYRPSLNGLRAFAIGGGPYVPAAADERAAEHAGEFVRWVVERLDRYRDSRGRPGLLVFAIDTELLGHWWYEGPAFLGHVVDSARAAGLALTTVPDALERHDALDRPLAESSWGRGKDLATWDSPPAAELLWTARRAELRLVAALQAKAAAESGAQGPVGDAAAVRAARELLALQASDWAFMVTRGQGGDYPRRRVHEHSAAFDSALGRRLGSGSVDPRLHGLAPGLRLHPLVDSSSARL